MTGGVGVVDITVEGDAVVAVCAVRVGGAVSAGALQPESSTTASMEMERMVRMRRGRGGGHMNRSKRSFPALQMGQVPGGPSRAQR